MRLALAAMAGGLLLGIPLVADAGPRTTHEILEQSQPGDWRQPDPAQTLYLDLPGGRVIIELAPRFAPAHVANIKRLVADRFFDRMAVVRVQDNFVAQWGGAADTHPSEIARAKLPAEFSIPWNDDLPLVKLPDRDGYAPETGWIDGFAVGVERGPRGHAWMTHCYGTVGVGRDDPPDTGSGAELYAVIGQAPRQLDRNIVVAGRVLRGIEHLSSLPRGTRALGFYEKPEQNVPLKSVRLAIELPEAQRTRIEVLRTDTPLFTEFVESRRNRREEWYLRPAGHIDVCNIAIPVRDVPVAAAGK